MSKEKQTTTPAPAYLSETMQQFWDEITASYRLDDDPCGLRMLESACQAGDRVIEARAILAKSGIVVQDRFGVDKAHPAVAIERDFRIQFLRALRELGIEAPDSDPRIPRTTR